MFQTVRIFCKSELAESIRTNPSKSGKKQEKRGDQNGSIKKALKIGGSKKPEKSKS